MSCEYISARRLDYYVNNPNAVIIDLRNREDYQQEHILNAVHMPYNQMEEQLNQLRLNKTVYAVNTEAAQQRRYGLQIDGRFYGRDWIFILYCQRGSLSLSICSRMTALGFAAKTVVGGIAQYRGRYLIASDKI